MDENQYVKNLKEFENEILYSKDKLDNFEAKFQEIYNFFIKIFNQ